MRLFNEHLVVAASKCLESRSRHDCPGAAEAHKCEKCDVIQVFHLEEITISSLQSGVGRMTKSSPFNFGSTIRGAKW
jgi:hypothetical protein